jgi:Leucine-rich repeat (LRR) protein
MGNRIGEAGATAIAEALKANSTLQQLNLFRSNIGASGAAAIAEALKVNSVLQKLDLSQNSISASGAAAIAEALKVNSVLQKLNLSRNNISASGAAALAEALNVNSALQQLILYQNAIGDSGVVAIEQSLERSFLGLELNSNARFPAIFHENLTRKHRFLYSLSDSGFRSFILNDVPPALWPHALAKVTMFPSLIFHLLLQIPGSSNFLV